MASKQSYTWVLAATVCKWDLILEKRKSYIFLIDGSLGGIASR
jgi:hypothetical protein